MTFGKKDYYFLLDFFQKCYLTIFFFLLKYFVCELFVTEIFGMRTFHSMKYEIFNLKGEPWMEEYYMAKEICKINKRISRTIEGILQKSPFTGSEGQILHFLLEEEDNGNIVYQKSIEKEFNLRPSSASEILKRMEQKGYILRVSVPNDARLKKIVATEDARNYAKAVRDGFLNFESLLTNDISDEDLEIFKRIILQLNTNLETIERKGL